MINLYVANTDNAWFDFLASQVGLTEVNFWWPGETAFRVLQQGEILAFRLKSPRNKIGGFGIFSSYSLLPIQMAWRHLVEPTAFPLLKGFAAPSRNFEQISPLVPRPTLVQPSSCSRYFFLRISGLMFRSRGHPALFEENNTLQTMKKAFSCGTGFWTRPRQPPPQRLQYWSRAKIKLHLSLQT